MRQYRKKPIVIEAEQWNGDNVTEILNFGNSGISPLWGDDFKVDNKTKQVIILTPEGYVFASKGDWIIKGIKGEFYPCKPDIFEATYELVE